MKRKVRIGTRGSKLALAQAQSVLTDLARLYPDTDFTIVTVKTAGDTQRISTDSVPSWGAFVKGLRQALLDERVDLAVHSLKDVPIEDSPGLAMAAITNRLDPRDVLVTRGLNIDQLPVGSAIGTGSPRRAMQIKAYRHDLQVSQIRGNVDSRISRVMRNEIDGIILAAAGLLRLGWEEKITQYLPLERFLPEAGQAALALEARTDDREMIDLVKPLHHEDSGRCVLAERSLLKALGGGCALAIGTLATLTDGKILLRAMVPGRDGLIYAEKTGDADSPEVVADRLAKKLVGRGTVIP